VVESDEWRCEDCGASLGGRAGCERAFQELIARAAADAAFAYRRRAVVDAYCLQHPAYIASLKSFAAHLCGLCAAAERASDPRASRAVWSQLALPSGAAKPALKRIAATATIAPLIAAATPFDFHAAADAWIAAVWDDWRDYHRLAGEWLDYSIAHQRRA
jgi:hypothetical protein